MRLPIVQLEHLLQGYAILCNDCQDGGFLLKFATRIGLHWRAVTARIGLDNFSRFRWGCWRFFFRHRQVVQHVEWMLEGNGRPISRIFCQGTDGRAEDVPRHFYNAFTGYQLEDNLHLRPQAHFGLKKHSSTGDIDDLSLRALAKSNAF